MVKAPAKIDLEYDFDLNLCVEVPPLSPMPAPPTIAGVNANVATLGLEYPSQSQPLDINDIHFGRARVLKLP